MSRLATRSRLRPDKRSTRAQASDQLRRRLKSFEPMTWLMTNSRSCVRAGDAVQLASCLHLQEALEDEIALVTFDERLLAAARKERVAVL